LVRQDDLPEDGPPLELEAALASLILDHHVRSKDVRRHEVRRELDTAELEVQDLAQGSDEKRLAQPRNSFQEAKPAGEKANQHFVDDSPLAHYDFPNLVANRSKFFPKLSGLRFHGKSICLGHCGPLPI